MGKKEETKHAKFIRLAEARTSKALNMIELIGNLSNRSFYEYTDEEIEKIFTILEREIRKSKEKFSKPNINKRRRFVL